MQMKEAYIDIVLLLLVRETSTYHQLKSQAEKHKEIWEVQLCTISERKATEATRDICIQHLKLTLFLLFHPRALSGWEIRHSVSDLSWKAFSLCMLSHTHKHKLYRIIPPNDQEKGKTLLSLKGYAVFFWLLFSLRMLSLWKEVKQTKLPSLVTYPRQRAEAGEKERKDGEMKMLDSVSAEILFDFRKKPC